MNTEDRFNAIYGGLLKTKDQIYNEQNGLHCTRRGDFYYPNLVYSKNDYLPLGKSGMLRKPYLKEIFKALFNKMLLLDELCPHLLEVDKQAHDTMDTIVARMKQGRGVTEQLKADDRWRRVQKMGYIHNAAEVFVLREVVNH